MKILVPIIFIVIVAIVLLIFSKAIKRKEIEHRGKVGEKKVAKVLGDNIPNEQYVINNLLFEDKEGHSCQIDHIYINHYGIWVIETKNYEGIIVGDRDQREWLERFPNSNKSYVFYNPIKQNATHIYRLADYLQTQNVFHNIVVFLKDADVSNVYCDEVYTIRTLSAIKTDYSGIRLTDTQMKEYYDKLNELQMNSNVTEEQHIENIKNMQNQIDNNICPRCGNKLVLREGKYGMFYGCSNYPSCKFKKKIDD